MHLETLAHGIVWHIFLSLDRAKERDVEIAVVTIAFAVVHFSAQAPRTFGVDFAKSFEVHVVVEGKVVAALSEVEAAAGLIAV